jgi:tetratricopeptide (TPR) repeat protein
MIRRCLICLVMVGVATSAGARSELAESWLRVQQALSAENREDIEQRLEEFKQTGEDLGVWRLTPYATALTLWARGRTDALGRLVLLEARSLDPELPTSHFLIARMDWLSGDRFGAIRSYLAGWWAVFLYDTSRHALIASSGIWVLVTLGWALAMSLFVQVLGTFRQLSHDAFEVSRLLFRRGNAVVLAAVILGLPVFAGLGPVWLVTYLFMLGMIYLPPWQRVVALTTCIVLALLMPAMAGWQQIALGDASLAARVSRLLEKRRVDPATVRELLSLEEELEEVPSYHLALGELLRMHGDRDAARLQFQKASLLDERDPIPLIALGNLSMEEGDIPRAIQRYDSAIELDPRSALAYHNLSSAYDQSRRFQEGDAARRMARQLAEGDVGSRGIRGGDARILYPRLGAEDVRRLVEQAPADGGLRTTTSAATEDPLRQLGGPLPRVFVVMVPIGLVVLFLRSRWLWVAQICSKCGKVFCPRCKTATESASYCSQCISVFLKRDVVSIEQQTAKMDQIRRWGVWSSVARRVLGGLVPGSHHLLDGAPVAGITVGFVAWLGLIGALGWAPLALPTVDPEISVLPVQIVLAILFFAVWLRSAVAAGYRR